MTGNDDPGDLANRDAPGETETNDYSATHDAPGLAGGLINSLALILLGASIGVFWREVFHLTIRMIQAIT